MPISLPVFPGLPSEDLTPGDQHLLRQMAHMKACVGWARKPSRPPTVLVWFWVLQGDGKHPREARTPGAFRTLVLLIGEV